MSGGGVDKPCCIAHHFFISASENPDRIAVVHAAGVLPVGRDSCDRSPEGSSDPDGEHLLASDGGSSVSSFPPLYPGDESFTYSDIVSAVDSLSRRIRRVLEGGDDPDLVRPKDFYHDKRNMAVSGLEDDMEKSTETNGMSLSDGTPQIIGVYIDPSVEYIVAVLSILRCGEAFLPLDPFWPEERILSVVSSSRTSFIIKCRPRLDAIDWIVDRSSCSVMYLSMKDGLKDHFGQSDLVWPCESRIPRKFCYLMYTSGSTGKPKGVCGTEKGLLNRFWWMHGQFPLCREDVLLFKTSISFVDHLQEFLGAILTCTTLIIPPFAELKATPLYVVTFLKAYHISRLTAVPSLMRAVLPSMESLDWMQIRSALKVLVLSGETLSVSLWKVLHELLPETTILNLYGSTEVSGDCMYFDCKSLPQILQADSLSSVPIGVPISNCEIDLAGEPETPDEGEIYVGGACLMTGYFGEPFHGHPIKYNCTLSPLRFRTGDFARRLESGDFVFIGRKDRVVKIYGQRVALEEIENALREHPEVSDAAVTHSGTNGGPSHLVAYFVIKTERSQKSLVDHHVIEDLIVSIRSWLVRKLPPAMIPTRYFNTELLPISVSGKIDYAMLSSSTYMPKQFRSQYEGNQSFDSHLQVIKEVFCDALQVKEVSDYDDFFMMGGNSVSAAHAAHKLGIDMRMLYIFPSSFKLLRALLDIENSSENFFIHNHDSRKKLKVDDNVLSSSDPSTINKQNSRLFRGVLHENHEERVQNLSVKGDANQPISHQQKNDGSPFSVGFSKIKSHVPPASDGAISVDAGQWISTINSPITCSYSRCNQFLHGGNEFSYVHQPCLSVEIPRYRKGHMQELWKVLLKSCVDASPLVVFQDGNINLFIGSHSHLFLCIDALRGIVRWEVILEGRIECSAAITGDFSQVVVGCYKGKIYFLDFMTGNISWSFQTDGEVKMQPVVDKLRNLIWCGSHDHWLYALDYRTHSCAYKISCGGSIYGSPSIDLVRNMIYVASTSGRVSGISIEVLPFSMIWLYESGAPIFGSLSLDSLSGNVISCLVDGHVIALNSRGIVIWKAIIGGPIFAGACISSALPSQALICSRNGSVYSFDTVGGALLWEYQVGVPITASAYVDEQSSLISEPSHPFDRLACICSSSGSIHVLRISSSSNQDRVHDVGLSEEPLVQEFATMELPGDVFSSPVMIGGRIFVGCRDDYVHCITVIT